MITSEQFRKGYEQLVREELLTGRLHCNPSLGFIKQYMSTDPETGQETWDNITPDDQTLSDAAERYDAVEANEQQQQIVESGAKAEIEYDTDWKSWTGDEAEAWIETNVNDLAGAKIVLRKMARLLIALRNKQFPDLQGS